MQQQEQGALTTGLNTKNESVFCSHTQQDTQKTALHLDQGSYAASPRGWQMVQSL